MPRPRLLDPAVVAIFAALVLALAPVAALAIEPAAVFQYAAPVETAKGPSQAFLWIPPDAPQVRGVVMAGMTLMEREFVKDPVIRGACSRAGLALVFLKCGLGAVQPQDVLDRLAVASGYAELAAAPLALVGHSAGGPQAKARAAEMPGRCFALVLYRGGVPGDAPAAPPGVPVLVMLGQFDEFGGVMRTEDGRETWEGGRDAVAAYRAADPRHLASLAVEPGAGHFAWSARNAALLAMFLEKAAAARIPAWPADAASPVACRDVDPAGGWLSDLAVSAASPASPAPAGEYRGDAARAAWHFDRDTAEATAAYHTGLAGRKDQFIRWADPVWVDAGARFFFTKLAWAGDGRTFEVHPVYADVYPGQYDGRGPRWPQAGQAVGRSAAPIVVRHVSGPVVVTGPNTLRMRYDALAPATEASRVTFMAASDGDAEFRYTEQVGMMPRGFAGLKDGRAQAITFPQPGDLAPLGPPVELAAVSDAGLAVEYYVAYGPATVEGNRLTVADLPARARLPVEVKVVAWQFGSALEPRVQTAAPVERVVRVIGDRPRRRP